MKKKWIANIIMCVIIAGIVTAGVLGVGHIRGWFDMPGPELAVLTNIRGIVNLFREGVSYPADNDTVLRAGDQLSCNPGATAVIALGENQLTIGEKAELQIETPAAEDFDMTVTAGEVFAIAGESMTLRFDGKSVTVSEAVVSLSVRTGTQTVNVYAGTVGNARAGQSVTYLPTQTQVSEMHISSLNTFLMNQVRSANKIRTLCFTEADLDKLQADRNQALQELLNSQTQPTEPDTTEPDTTEPDGTKPPVVDPTEPDGSEPPAVDPTEPDGTEPPAVDPTEPDGTEPPAVDPTEPEETEPPVITPTEPKQTEAPAINPTEPEETEPPAIKPTEPEQTEPPATRPTTSPETEPEKTEYEDPPEAKPTEPEEDDGFFGYCTITIRCDTILDNWNNLEPGKAEFVPADGVILYPVRVGFYEGETVFEVLKRVCEAADIQLEYSWTPLYGSYYIEGINNLYEFDCGEQSGWMYKVNEWFPNYGCSSYTLVDGDVIVWCFTCNGQGADVGGPAW